MAWGVRGKEPSKTTLGRNMQEAELFGMKRLFIGIPLAEEVKQRLALLQQELRETAADLNLVPPENLHFTLKFLGEVEEQKIPELTGKLSTIQLKKFTLGVQGVGVFPSLERINVVWVGVQEGSKELILLTNQVNKLLNYIREDRREEIPHLTVARVKSGKNKEKVREIVEKNKDTVFGEMNVDKLVLYESELKPEKAVYRVVKVFRPS